MRLFDKLIAANNIGSEVLRETAQQFQTVQVVADEVAMHYYHNNKQWWSAEDYPYFISPWSSAFVEWTTPRKGLFLGGWEDFGASIQYGMSVLRISGKESIHRNIDTLCDKSGIPQITDSRAREAEHLHVFSPYYSCLGVTGVLNSLVLVFSDRTGLVMLRAAYGMKNSAGEEALKEEVVDTFIHVLGLVFTFANCNNVTTEERSKDFAPKDKLRRRFKIPEIKRYTLVIDGHSTHRNQSAPLSETGVMPFHLCRGHFATYTKEKPLFGKLTGRFWVPAHMRGNKRNGEIIKDYKVSMNTAEGVASNGQRVDQDAGGFDDTSAISDAHKPTDLR